MSSSTGTVVFNDSRVRAVDVIANEKVGIGTSLPTSNLHVSGNAYVTSNLEVGTANLFVDTTTGRVGVGTSLPTSNLHLVGNAYVTSNLEIGTANLFVDTTTGRVGVGTGSPAGLLDIRASSTDPGAVPTVHIGDAAADAGDYGMVNLVRHATTGGSKCHLSFIRNGNMVAGMGYYNNTDTLGIWNAFSSVTNTPSISIQSNHNVGIGTTNPGTTLDINGTIRTRQAAGWKSGTFDSTGVNMGPMADGTTDGPQIGWEYHVTFSVANAQTRVVIYGAYKSSGALYGASEKWTWRFREGYSTLDYSNYAELVNDGEPNADTYYAVIRVVNSLYNNATVVAARHHFMSHSVGCLRGIGATIYQASGYIDMGGESADDRFNYLRLTSSSGNIKGQWTAFPITT